MSSRIVILVEEHERVVLEALGRSFGYDNAEGTLRYLVSEVVDGVRRPGSWERGVVMQLFGPDAVDRASFELRSDPK